MKVPVHKIQKISINKSDEVALVVEKIIDADAKEIVLNIPRFSRLADSLANFHLIKREANLLRKKVIVESVDDKVIELSGVAGLESWNPILSRSRRQFSDIVSSRQTKEEADESDIKKKKLVESVGRKPARHVAIKPKWRRFAWLGALLLILGGSFFFANTVLPRADIKITAVKDAWSYNDSVRAEKLGTIDSKFATIPGQVFIATGNLQLSFPASGKKSVEQKSAGKVLIYNAYSSEPQPLVATTRFVTPDGKIFRLSKSVTVPGAKVVEGRIIPSTLEAPVVADQPGAEFNIGPVSHFTIPGFKGTPKYEAFYGESKEPMTGGFIGEVAFPTEADLKKSKTEIVQKIESLIREKILAQVPADFKIIDGASSFTLTKQNVITETSGNNFSIAAEAKISEIAFREADAVKMLEEKMKKEKGSEYEFKSFEIKYGVARSDFNAGRLSFPATLKAVIAKSIDMEALRRQVKGKSEEELKTLIYGLPDLQSAEISLWPFWVKKVPQNEAKISIVVN